MERPSFRQKMLRSREEAIVVSVVLGAVTPAEIEAT